MMEGERMTGVRRSEGVSMADPALAMRGIPTPHASLELTSQRKVADRATWLIFAGCATGLIVLIGALILYIGSKGLAFFFSNHFSVFTFLFTTAWDPTSKPADFGAATFIVGSLEITLLAILISTPLSVAAALFLTEVGPKWAQNVLQPAIELFVGIPSVVYGWVGLSVLVPFIRNHIGGLGFSWLAGSLVLSIMAMPTITSVSTDAIRALPVGLKEASFGLGATRWQTLSRVLIPAALPGLLTAVILGMARAIGEALAVQMVIGNTPIIPKSLTDRAITLTSEITLDLGNTVGGTQWNNALWTMALLLLTIALMLILAIRLVSRKRVYQ
jgi:phosphate transport system permease protein